MRFIRDLNPETQEILEKINRTSDFPQVRDRAKCIILSSQGYSIKSLMSIFNVSRKTIFNWLTRWEEQGVLGLYNRAGQGRKPKLSLDQKRLVKEWVKAEPKALNKIRSKIHKTWGIEVSKDTIKRIIKKWNLTWKRMKRGMSKSPDEWELEQKC
jgi:transposase